METTVTLKVPEDAVRLFGDDAARFGREMFEAAVVRWFEEGRISQGQSSQLLGISRAEFMEVLSNHGVSPIQMTAEELEEEFRRG